MRASRLLCLVVGVLVMLTAFTGLLPVGMERDDVQGPAHLFREGAIHDILLGGPSPSPDGLIRMRNGTHVYIEVETQCKSDPNDGGNNNWPSDQMLDAMLDDFDNSIYPKLTGVYWPPGQSGPVAERIIPIDGPKNVGGYYNGNHRVQVDCADLGDMSYLAGHRILAHEFFHLLQSENTGIGSTKIAEGLADIAIAISYEPNDRLLQGHTMRFMQNHDLELLQWHGKVEDYGQGYDFYEYIREHYGDNASMKTIAENPNGFKTGVNTALQNANAGKTFDEVFTDFTVAMLLDDVGISSGEYGYPWMDMPIYMPLDGSHTTYPASGSGSAVSYAASYIGFDNAVGDLNISVSISSGNFAANVVLIGNQGVPNDVRPIQISGGAGSITLSDLGTTYRNATLVLSATSGGSFSYDAEISGSPGTGSISGKVKEPSGTGIAGATVELHNSSTGALVATTTSSASGDYALTSVPPGTYDIVGKMSGYSDGTLSGVSLNPGQALTGQDLVLTPMSSGGIISGTVTDTASTPLAGVSVQVYNAGDRSNPVATDTTAPDGTYGVSVAPGAYDVVANMTGYDDAERNGVQVSQGQTAVVDLTMSPWSGNRGTISGKVRDALTGAGIPGADVRLYPAGSSTLLVNVSCDTTGRFSVSVPAGDYDLKASSPGYIDGSVPGVSVDAGGSLAQDIDLEPEPASLGSIQGTVTDTGGSPVENAEVMVSGPVTRTASTDLSGRYSITGLPAGRYAVAATASGYRSASMEVVLHEGGDVTADLQLEPLGGTPGTDNPFLVELGGIPAWALLILVVGALVAVLFMVRSLTGGPICYNCGSKNRKGDALCRSCLVSLKSPTYTPPEIDDGPGPPPR